MPRRCLGAACKGAVDSGKFRACQDKRSILPSFPRRARIISSPALLAGIIIRPWTGGRAGILHFKRYFLPQYNTVFVMNHNFALLSWYILITFDYFRSFSSTAPGLFILFETSIEAGFTCQTFRYIQLSPRINHTSILETIFNTGLLSSLINIKPVQIIFSAFIYLHIILISIKHQSCFLISSISFVMRCFQFHAHPVYDHPGATSQCPQKSQAFFQERPVSTRSVTSEGLQAAPVQANQLKLHRFPSLCLNTCGQPQGVVATGDDTNPSFLQAL